MFITLAKYLRSFLIIYGCLFLGVFVMPAIPIQIPGSVIGLIILFFLLSFQIIPADWVYPGCTLLIRYMALLFVPVGVGVMQYGTLLHEQFGPIVISCLASTLIVMMTVSTCSHFLHTKKGQITL